MRAQDRNVQHHKNLGDQTCQPIIAFFAYNRADAAIRSLDSLAQAEGSDQYALRIHMDGAKPGHEEGVAAVRSAIESWTTNDVPFRSVETVVRAENWGLARSIISGVSACLESAESVIVLEDDLVLHRATLRYFQHALNRYKNQPMVQSVSAYSFPEERLNWPADYAYDAYLSTRLQVWSWATWRDRWAAVDWAMTDYPAFAADPHLTKAYRERIGEDAFLTLGRYMRGEIDVWACRWAFEHFRRNSLCLCPTLSLVHNAGLDGQGQNCGRSQSFDIDLGEARPSSWSMPWPVALPQGDQRRVLQAFSHLNAGLEEVT